MAMIHVTPPALLGAQLKRMHFGGIGLGMLGGIVGAVLGSLKIKIPINGSLSKYRTNLPRLKKYAYQK